jgi:UDP-N-acetylglucosamine 4,6-dehydratase
VSFDFTNKRILITGGTGSFGQAFTALALKELPIKTLCIFSRDELKQAEMASRFEGEKRLRFFVGDVRDRDRVKAAMEGVDLVIHAAAMKRVEACEYNPFEAIQTNILGTQNVVREAIAQKVSHVMALSTDKAVNPVNLYGATKLCLEKIVTANNNVVGKRGTKLACVRYGNVAGSRGSVIHTFREQLPSGVFTVTDERMTRFWITLPEAVAFVLNSIQKMQGGEVFTPRLPSFRVTDLVKAFDEKAKFDIIGIRQGEKLHEVMVSADEPGGPYDSGANETFLTVQQLKTELELLK